MNHFTASGSERGGISHDVDRMNAEPRAAVSTQRRTSASIASLVVFSNFVASTLPIATARPRDTSVNRSEEHTSELQSRLHLVCRLLLEKKKRSKARQSAVRVVTPPHTLSR